jgi:hypothetical protein
MKRFSKAEGPENLFTNPQTVKKGDYMKDNNTEKQHENLAVLISGVLNHPDLPEPMREVFREAITTAFNEHIDQSEVDAFEKSPEYIGMIIRGYQRRAAYNLPENVRQFQSEVAQ